ncbi:alanyl-trna synthetase [Hordeum vulgare]|nr:alanyl-trna synthetase [Hordeum vulgare]
MNIKIPELHGLTWSRDILCDPRFNASDRAKIITVMWAIRTSWKNITHDTASMDPVYLVQTMPRAELAAEASAVLEGVVIALLCGFAWVQIETDSLEVVNLWNSRRTLRSVIAPLLLDIEELAVSFLSFDIHHVRRHANIPAHLCAKHASTLEVSECWMDSPPGLLVTSLMANSADASSYE